MILPVNPVPAVPAILPDGTSTAIVAAPATNAGGALLLTLALPPLSGQQRVGGRYGLARCGAQSPDERAENWQIYLRRPLLAAGRRLVRGAEEPEDHWLFWMPGTADPGYRWLAGLPPGAPVNLIGPAGNGFYLDPAARHLLLLAEPQRAPLVLPLADEILDRGGYVTMLLRGAPVDEAFLRSLPVAIEVHSAHNDGEWVAALNDRVRWADQICGALPASDLLPLAETIRHRRFRLDPGFALLLMEADLACGYGACLACVIPLANGNLTRACIHGPVFDLLELVGRS